MTISVAIATYNRQAMVVEAAQAALEQSRAPKEVVISDDASTDGTVEVIERLARQDSRVKVIRQARNSGGVENWNAAIRATRGDLIAWCSDDDRFLRGHLEASAAYLERHPEIGLVHSGFIDAIETGCGELRQERPLRRESVLTRRGLPGYMIRYYDWPFHPSTIVMRRRVWDQVGPFNRAFQFADTEWFLRVAEKFPIASLARYGVLNRRHAGNWSNRLGSAHLQREVFEIVEQAIARNYRWPQRTMWRGLWRANARLRLALTLRERLRSAHLEAASLAWQTLARDTGFRGPQWIEDLGLRMIRAICAGREHRFRDAGQSVSPL